MTPEELEQILFSADCLYTETEVEDALDVLSVQITERLKNSNPLVLCVMNGGLIPAGKLLTRLPFPLQLDYLHATRYRGDLQGRDIQWLAKPVYCLEARTVLIIDDIFDEGHTLAAIKQWCLTEGAREVLTAVLVDKQHDRKTAALQHADFTGLYAEDRYLFGYGMDYKGYWRNAPGIYAI